MRERFDEAGFNGWSDHEVLEFMLFYVIPRQDTNALAHNILNGSAKSLSGMFSLAESGALLEIDGVGKKTSDFLRHIKAFYDYYRIRSLRENPVRLTAENFTEVLSVVDFAPDSEELFIICLDRNMVVKYASGIADAGGEDYARVSPGRIMRIAESARAAFVVLVHNHPSGNPEPSYDDVYMTEMTERMLSALGVFLIDHYIICGKEITSMRMSVLGGIDGK